ncbi:DUF1189 domain-containing protein [Bacillus sp. USDA818B3_A]|uniref:DUF1189 domain-containing protein n=1 Tax=Bacillus sp. USDA818B3_A TaxID=2698834 RepID=UPI0013685611|nr:DUF1189 domain-containing protein [Bacillus sp. USDA818B3_A]
MNIFKQFFKSIYSPRDIALFRFQGIGKTILYVFFLTFVSILPSIIYFSTALIEGIDAAKTILKDEAPSFSVQNGRLTAKTDVPVTIDKGNFTIIIDPTGAMSEEDAAEAGNAFALLKDKFALASAGTVESYPYSMMTDLHITNNNLFNFLDTIGGMKGIIIPVVSLFIYLFSSAASFIEVSVLALIGLALKGSKKLNYRQMWRMAAYSETLPTVFFTIMTTLRTAVPNSFIINWFVVIIVLYLAIKEVPKPKSAQKDVL